MIIEIYNKERTCKVRKVGDEYIVSNMGNNEYADDYLPEVLKSRKEAKEAILEAVEWFSYNWDHECDDTLPERDDTFEYRLYDESVVTEEEVAARIVN